MAEARTEKALQEQLEETQIELFLAQQVGGSARRAGLRAAAAAAAAEVPLTHRGRLCSASASCCVTEGAWALALCGTPTGAARRQAGPAAPTRPPARPPARVLGTGDPEAAGHRGDARCDAAGKARGVGEACA